MSARARVCVCVCVCVCEMNDASEIKEIKKLEKKYLITAINKLKANSFNSNEQACTSLKNCIRIK